MNKFRKKSAIVEAVQITDSTFDAPHPNPEHVRGVFYNPLERTVSIKALGDSSKAGIGDWIVRSGDDLWFCSDFIFKSKYEEVKD